MVENYLDIFLLSFKAGLIAGSVFLVLGIGIYALFKLLKNL